MGTLNYQNTVFNKEIGDKIADECFVISMAHHPLGWYSYETKYEKTLSSNDFEIMMEYSDVYLCGHQHIPHYKPSVFRQHAYVLESPQLLDYHMFMELPTNIVDRALNLGFALIQFDHERSNFNLQQFEPNIKSFYEKKGLKIKQKSRTYGLMRKKHRSQKTKLISRRTLLNDFKDFKEICEYLEKNFKVSEGDSRCCDKFVHKNVLINDLSEDEKFPPTTNVQLSCFHCLHNDKLALLLVKGSPSTPEKWMPLIGKKNETWGCQVNSDLTKLVKQWRETEKGKMREIRFLFLDHWVYKLVDKKFLGYGGFYNEIYERFTAFKYHFFKDKENRNLFKEIGLSFEIIPFERYKDRQFLNTAKKKS